MALTLNGSNNTIAGVAVGGLPDGIVDTDMIAADAVTAPKIGAKAFTSYAVIVDQKNQNTESGTFTSGAWQTRDLNTESFDPDGIVSISSNKFTLAAGSYLIVWSAPCYKVDKNQTRLYDVTNSSAGAGFKGSVEHAGTTTAIQVRSTGAMRVSPSGSNEYRIEHKSAATRADNGFGFAANLAAEIFTIVEIYKEA